VCAARLEHSNQPAPIMRSKSPPPASVNVPDDLVSALVRQKRMRHVEALLIHISSDQVGGLAGAVTAAWAVLD
jgi:hypothetical protein